MTTVTMEDVQATNLMALAGASEMAQWSDDKKKAFCATFAERAKAARYVHEATGRAIQDLAQKRRFISQIHIDKMGRKRREAVQFDDPHAYNHYTIGGRAVQQLNEIAEARAKATLEALPPIRAAVLVISPEVGAWMDRIVAIDKELQPLKEQLGEVAQAISMQEEADRAPTLTVVEFLAMVKARDQQRKRLVAQVNDLSEERGQTDVRVAKALYAGLPGLTDAVVRVIEQYWERSTALDQTTRRVTEQVLFGDSEAALQLLRHFEQDEVTVSADVKREFDEALQQLKVAVQKGARLKQIGG